MKCKRCALEICDAVKYCPECGKKQTQESRPPDKKSKQRTGNGNMRKLPSGKYQARVSRDRKAVALGTYETESEAVRAINAFGQNPIATQDKYNYTLGDVYNAYCKSIRYKKLSESGKEGIKAAWVHLRKLEKEKMRELDKSAYEQTIQTAQKVVRYKKRTGAELARMKPSERKRYENLCMQRPEKLSRESRLKVKNLVKLLCAEAMGTNIISTNYGALIAVDGEASAAHGVLSAEMRERIFAIADKYDEAKLVLIYTYMGWRAMELLDMQKSQVHLKPENSERGNFPDGYCVGGIKTEAGRHREVPIHKSIVPYVQYFAQLPSEWFITLQGRHVTYDIYLRKVFPSVLKLAGIPAVDDYGDKISPHSTRNTFALMLYESNVASEIIAKLMGHSNFDVTNKKYIRNRQSREYTAGEFARLAR